MLFSIKFTATDVAIESTSSQSNLSMCYCIVKHNIHRKTTYHLTTLRYIVREKSYEGGRLKITMKNQNTFLSLKNGWDTNKESEE